MRLKNSAESGRYSNRKLKTEIKKQAVLSILREMEQLDDPSIKPISKLEICRRAGVCRSFLRNNNELREQVNKAISRNMDKPHQA